jgi:hypothetical protein
MSINYNALGDIINREKHARTLALRYCRRIPNAATREYARAFMAHVFDGAECPREAGIGEVSAWCVRMRMWQCKDVYQGVRGYAR